MKSQPDKHPDKPAEDVVDLHQPRRPGDSKSNFLRIRSQNDKYIV